ncbi:MAG: T9SS C-terminal target domain-containing protein, partial [Saprospiraceae bacterium]|nr:T9SS C-terminal target domain-containing protein [Saprospiraceae bacterium]
MKKIILGVILLSILIFNTLNLSAQFDPAAGQAGSLAVYKDSSIFINWATAASIDLGYQNISNTSLGLVNTGNASATLGQANGASVLSLGDGGSAILTFEYPIRNGQGADFAVFENAFSDTFLELAFVEVSSDGTNFVRFPSISNTDTSTQIDGFGLVDASKLYNLAGKYRVNYGVPFDLEELKDSSNLDVNAITHVRIIDVVGSIDPDFVRRDSRGVKINDPWPTPFASGGFDLDAVGVIHQNISSTVSRSVSAQTALFYPNPAKSQSTLQINQELSEGTLVSLYT